MRANARFLLLALLLPLAGACDGEPEPNQDGTKALAHEHFDAIVGYRMAAEKKEGWAEAGHRYIDEYFEHMARLKRIGDPDAALQHALLKLETDFDKASLNYEDYEVLKPVP